MVKYLFILFAIFCISSGNIFAGTDFKATANPSHIECGEQVRVTFEINRGGLSAFKSPQFYGFNVVAGPMQSSYTQIINGRSKQSFSVSYVLEAKKAGNFKINPASCYIGGKKVYSNSVKITVSKSSGNSHSNYSAGGKNTDDNNRIDATAKQLISKNLFMKLSVNKRSVAPGEPVYAVYKLYANPALNVLNIAAPKMPVYDGCWASEIELPQISYTSTEIVKGKRYKVAELKKVVLFPTRSGKLTVEPLSMDFTVRLPSASQQSNDPMNTFFDDPFSNDYEDFRYHTSSGKAEINVSKLPEPVPADFVNATGHLNLSVSVDKQNVKTNEPVTLSITISGTGNLSLIESPQTNFPVDFDRFDPKIADNTEVTPNGITGTRTFKYILIPQKAGKYEIPGIRFTFFDFSADKYVSTSSSSIAINVEKGIYSGKYPQDISGTTSSSGRSPAKIKQSTQFSDINYTSPFASPEFLIPVTLMLAIFLLIYFRKKRQDKEKNNPNSRQINAGEIAMLRFATARTALQAGNENKFFDELNRTILNYMNKNFKEVSNPETVSLPRYNITDSQLAKRVTDFLENCNRLRYAPKDSNRISPEEMLSEGISIIKELENYKHKK